MSKRKVSNPLALAVLAQLAERPMHPYEVAAQMRSRGVEEAVKLNYGSLYSVIEALLREGLIVPLETQREGRRPERTVYGLAEAGRAEFFTWLRELLSTPAREYTQFAAGLAFIGHLAPTEAAALLEGRAGLLAGQVDEMRATLNSLIEQGLCRLFLIEQEHGLVLLEAELAWVRRLIGEIRDGSLTAIRDGTPVWKAVLDVPTPTGGEQAREEGDA